MKASRYRRRWRIGRPRRGRAPDASERLLALGPEAGREALISAARDPSVDVARQAIGWLARRGGRPERDALRALLWTCDPMLVEVVASALRRLGDQRAVTEAVGRLRAATTAERCRAARALRALADRSATPALCEALADRDGTVRGAALDALARIGRGRRAAAAIAPLVGDPSAEVRLRAVRALGRVGPAPGVIVRPAVGDSSHRVRHEVALLAEHLRAADVAQLLADREPEVRAAAAASACDEAQPWVIEALARDPHPSVRRAAAARLAHIGGELAAEALVDAIVLDGDALVRQCALLRAAEAMSRRRLVAALRARLQSGPPRRRAMALRALARLEAQLSPGEAAALARDADVGLRLTLAEVARLVTRDPLAVLDLLAGDEDPGVRHAAQLHRPLAHGHRG